MKKVQTRRPARHHRRRQKALEPLKGLMKSAEKAYKEPWKKVTQAIGAAVMKEAGLQARKVGRAAAAKADRSMTDNVADKIARYSKPSGMVLISGDLLGIGAKNVAR